MILTTNHITRLLRWTDVQYGEFVHATGIAYLNAYIPGDRHGIDMLSRNRIFWNWWKNHWQIRDRQFLEIACEHASKTALERLYYQHHRVDKLVNEIYPNAQILSSSYCRMIGDLQDAK